MHFNGMEAESTYDEFLFSIKILHFKKKKKNTHARITSASDTIIELIKNSLERSKIDIEHAF